MKYFFSYFILFIISFNTYSQCTQGSTTTFQKVFGGAGNERAHSVQQTADGGYIIVGETTSFGAGNKDWFVMKMDANGNLMWTKTYGSNGTEDGQSISVKEISGGGFIIAGQTNGFGSSAQDPFVIKLDDTGNVLWEKRISGSGNDFFRAVIETSSGNYMLAGTTNSYGAGNSDYYVVKLDASGNMLWNKTYGGNSTEHATSIVEVTNNNFIIVGTTKSYGAGTQQGFMLSIDQNGNLNWSKAYGGSNKDNFNSVALLSSNELLIVGYAESYGAGQKDIFVVKTDLLGNLIWSSVYGGNGEERAVNVIENLNSEILISARTNSIGMGSIDYLIINIDNNGIINWVNTFGGTGNDEVDYWGDGLALSTNTQQILVGGTNNFGATGEDIYVVLTNNCGQSFCNESISNINTTSPIPSVTNVNPNIGSGGTIINTSLAVNTINFSNNILCIDTTLSNTCNLDANFSTVDYCEGDTTLFTDLSTDSTGNIVNWQWYFGDGDSIAGIQNPSHTYSNSGIYNVTLVVTNDSNCIDSITIPITIYPIITFNRNDSICQGDSILLGGSFQNTSGVYTDSLQTTLGCDSIVYTSLTINQIYSITVDTNVCQGDSILLGGGYQTNTGTYIDTFQTVNGCDSIVVTNLIIYPIYSLIQNDTICQGDSILFNGLFYNLSGVYTDSLQTINGCDSLLTLNLTVNQSFLINEEIHLCQGDSVYLAGSFQTIAGNYIDTFQTNNGCDSVINTTLLVDSIYNVYTETIICEGESIYLEGNYQTVSGLYIDSLQTINGCDSILTTNLIVNSIPDVIAFSDTTIDLGQSVQLLAVGADAYEWTPVYSLDCSACPTPIATPIVTTEYIVTGYMNGCTSTDTVLVEINKLDVTLYIPNTFSPDGDGVNDVFYFYATGFKEFEAMIFDRWGELLYESVDISEGWDATYKGKEVPLGIYVYRVKVVSFDNEYVRKTGAINVIK